MNMSKVFLQLSLPALILREQAGILNLSCEMWSEAELFLHDYQLSIKKGVMFAK